MCIEGKMKVINQLKHQAQYQLARGPFFGIFFFLLLYGPSSLSGLKKKGKKINIPYFLPMDCDKHVDEIH